MIIKARSCHVVAGHLAGIGSLNDHSIAPKFLLDLRAATATIKPELKNQISWTEFGKGDY